MKYCKYCGKGLHTASSFCPYCMKSQIAKQSAAMQQKKSKNIRYRFLEAGLLLLLCAAIAVLCLLVWGKEPAETSSPSGSAIDTVKSSAATWTEPAQSTTVAATASVQMQLHPLRRTSWKMQMLLKLPQHRKQKPVPFPSAIISRQGKHGVRFKATAATQILAARF